jgi:hypothetical protein
LQMGDSFIIFWILLFFWWCLNLNSICMFACTPCFDYSDIYLHASNAENPCAQRFFGCAVWSPMGKFLLFWASNCFCLCVKIIGIVHHTGNSAQRSISSTHTKFSNWGSTNTLLMHANKHYTANLCGVNVQLRAQSCPSNQNMGEGGCIWFLHSLSANAVWICVAHICIAYVLVFLTH